MFSEKMVPDEMRGLTYLLNSGIISTITKTHLSDLLKCYLLLIKIHSN